MLPQFLNPSHTKIDWFDGVVKVVEIVDAIIKALYGFDSQYNVDIFQATKNMYVRISKNIRKTLGNQYNADLCVKISKSLSGFPIM